MTFDHGELNLPLHKRGAGSIDAQIDRWKKAESSRLNGESKAAAAARRQARETERTRDKFTAADLEGAQFVRDRHGWHEVVRVSAKSVTVATPYSWTDRIPLDRVLEVRHQAGS